MVFPAGVPNARRSPRDPVGDAACSHARRAGALTFVATGDRNGGNDLAGIRLIARGPSVVNGAPVLVPPARKPDVRSRESGERMEASVPDVTRFAGYPSPQTLMADPSLSRDDKISGLRTWRQIVLRIDGTAADGEHRRRLLKEIDQALALLMEARSANPEPVGHRSR